MTSSKEVCPESGRVFGLDIMRSVAILLVVLCHALMLIRFKYPVTGWAVLSGMYGVELFFVLSGFLIGGILLRDFGASQNASVLPRFWVRRWFRTLPNYYLFLILNIALTLWLGKLPADLWKYPFFLQSLTANMSSMFFAESWSLAVEEWFYLITPVAIFLILKATGSELKQAALLTIVLVIAGASAGRIWYVTNTETETLNSAWGVVIYRLDACMFGVLGAWIKHYHPDSWKRRPLFCLILGLCLLICSGFMFRYLNQETSIQLRTNFFTLVSVSCLLMIPFLDQLKNGSGSVKTIFTRVSLWSYSAYLVNFPIFLVIHRFLGKSIREDALVAFACAIGSILLTFLIAALNYRIFELPVTRLRDRFFPVQKPALPTP